jgi:DNA-binding transcriptional LysR family regulator
MGLHHLRHFVAVAEEGQVSAAARRLFIAQPALSQSVRTLERELGVELFVRHPRGVALTAAGEDLLVEARATVAAADRAMAAAAAHRRGRQQELIIGYMRECFELLAGPLSWLARARPDITVQLRELTFADQERRLRVGDVDVALLGPPPSELPQHILFFDPLLVALPASHPLAARDDLTVEDLGYEPFPRAPHGAPADWVDTYQLTAARGQPPRTTRDPVFDAPGVLAEVLLGHCVTASPAFLADRFARGNPIARPLAGEPKIAFGFAWTRTTPALRALVETLRCAEAEGETVQPG